jgi:hypothetical protein
VTCIGSRSASDIKIATEKQMQNEAKVMQAFDDEQTAEIVNWPFSLSTAFIFNFLTWSNEWLFSR